MRILGFDRHWPKLDDRLFTTFRFPRKDTDWMVGERVQLVIKPRSKDREPIGYAVIVEKQILKIRWITEKSAQEDGFESRDEMMKWLGRKYRDSMNWLLQRPINRLRLHKVAGLQPRSKGNENKTRERSRRKSALGDRTR